MFQPSALRSASPEKTPDNLLTCQSPRFFGDSSITDAFLASLAGTGKTKYKRYARSPLRYAGGKSLAVGLVIEHFPRDVRRHVSPFFGGGSVEIAAANELGIEVTGYDVFDILANYWRVQLAHPLALSRAVRRWKPTKEVYARVKHRLRGHWKGDKPIRDARELAALFWFNYNLSYGPGFLGWMSSIYEDDTRVTRMIDRVEAFECPNLSVSSGDFAETLPRHRRDFLYCDPPYYLDGDSKMFRGIYPQRNFPVHHNGFDHARLRDLLSKHRGGFILSYNDCRVVREWYRSYKIIEVKWQYTLGQGETRIGKNRMENGARHHVKQSHELLIVSTP